jgi:type II secretory pathway pseudopilin PulG
MALNLLIYVVGFGIMNTISLMKNQKGFSFLEAIMATAILAVGLVGGLTVLQNATLHTMNQDRSTIATELATSKMEEIIADHEFIGAHYILDIDNYDRTETEIEGFPGFSNQIIITKVDPSDLETPDETSSLTKIEVIVSWSADEGNSVSASTLLTDSGSTVTVATTEGT